MWQWKDTIFNSKFNGQVKLKKFLGRYSVWVNGFEQSGSNYVEKIWKNGLEKVNFFPKNILILGLGCGTLVKLISKKWPEARISGVEIDPVMIDLGKKYFGLDKYKNLKIILSDVKKFLTKPQPKFDLVFVDFYKGNIPEKQKINYPKILNKNGVILINHLEGLKNRIEYLKF